MTISPIDDYVKTLEDVSGCKLYVTSGYRSPSKNRAVGGAPNSFHLKDRARDLVTVDPSCITYDNLAKVACRLGISTIQYTNHLHIDDRKPPLCIRGSYKGVRDENQDI